MIDMVTWAYPANGHDTIVGGLRANSRANSEILQKSKMAIESLLVIYSIVLNIADVYGKKQNALMYCKCQNCSLCSDLTVV